MFEDYKDQSEVSEFNAIMCGPSGVGKTSLITSILDESHRLFAKRNLFLRPADELTDKRIKKNKDDLDGSINMGVFKPESFKGTEGYFPYKLELGLYKKAVPWWKRQVPGLLKKDKYRPETSIKWGICDYNGGWIDKNLFSKKDFFEKWCKHSSILLIPIDAPATMNPSSARNSWLQISSVESVTREWAKAKINHDVVKGLAILAPVKCESYFTDNGGNKGDRSQELYEKVTKVYKPIIDSILDVSKKISIEYHPIDTLGCVDLDCCSRWEPKPNKAGELWFNSTYKVRENGSRSPFGGKNLLLSICRYIVETHREDKYSGAFSKFFEFLRGYAPELLNELDLLNNSNSVSSSSRVKYIRK